MTSFDKRHLQFTIYATKRRVLRRGHWSQWRLDIVTTFDDTDFCWTDAIASGWTKRNFSGCYAQFTIGEETLGSHEALLAHHGIAIDAIRRSR